MPFAQSESVKLYYETTGSGVPIVFVHEFAGDHRSWEPQVRFFARRYRCVTFSARGYPPSEVPASARAYSQAGAAKDIASVMRHLHLGSAHIIGFSMGSYAALHFVLSYARMARSVTLVGLGYGSDPDKRSQFLRDNELMAERFESLGTQDAIKPYQVGPARIQYHIKDPRGFSEFCGQFAEHSAAGSANTLRGIQARRPTIYALAPRIRRVSVPMHLITGDEDDNALEPSIFVKRICTASRLTVIPASGHMVNLEEPELFNRLSLDFLTLVDTGAWRPRDPRSREKSMVTGGAKHVAKRGK